MPAASGKGAQKYHYKDHESVYVDPDTVVEDVWYEVFHDYNVRLLWCVAYQANQEAAAKEVWVRWTIDGIVTSGIFAFTNNTEYWIYRDYTVPAAGVGGLKESTSEFNAAKYIDKRGIDFKVEIRQNDPVGTNQTLACYCVYETLEETPY